MQMMTRSESRELGANRFTDFEAAAKANGGYTVRQAATRLGVSISMIYRMLKSNTLQCRRITISYRQIYRGGAYRDVDRKIIVIENINITPPYVREDNGKRRMVVAHASGCTCRLCEYHPRKTPPRYLEGSSSRGNALTVYVHRETLEEIRQRTAQLNMRQTEFLRTAIELYLTALAENDEAYCGSRSS
jgi:hypothetical protein